MPYDNKQCKSYNGIKLKYATLMKDSIDDENPVIVTDWNNDMPVGSPASALIDLDLVGSPLKPTGYGTLLDTLNAQTVTSFDGAELTPSAMTYSTMVYNLSPELLVERSIDQKTSVYTNVIDNINTIINTINDLSLYSEFGKTNPLIDTTVSAIINLVPSGSTETETEKINAAYNNLVSAFMAGGVLSSLSNTEFEKLLYYNSDFDISFEQVNEKYNQVIPTSAFNNTEKVLLATDIPATVIKAKAINTYFAEDYYKNYSLIDCWDSMSKQLNALEEKVRELAEDAGIDLTFYKSAYTQASKLQTYLRLEKYGIDTSVSNAYKLLQTDLLAALASGDVLKGETSVLTGDAFHFINMTKCFNFIEQDINVVSAMPAMTLNGKFISDQVSLTGAFETSLAFSRVSLISNRTVQLNLASVALSSTYETPCGTFSVTGNIETNALTGEINADGTGITFVNAFTIPSTDLKYEIIPNETGEFPSDFNIEVESVEVTQTEFALPERNSAWFKQGGVAEVIDLAGTGFEAIETAWNEQPTLEGRLSGTEYSFNDLLAIFKAEIQDTIDELAVNDKIKINGKGPGELEIPSGVIADVLSGTVSAYLTTLLTDEFDTEVPSGKALSELDATLAKIYNDPYFRKFDDALSGQAVVDSHLLTTDEIGYKYGVYLDSKECNISNEQYDDLVTGNKFTKKDYLVSKYGEDIDTANFVIIDKQKTIADGVGSNNGYFTTVIDPFDALKMQRLFVNPVSLSKPTLKATSKLADYGDQSAYNWKVLFRDAANTLDTLQHVTNADGLLVGEKNQLVGKEQLLDTWSVPLTGNYYDESISKSLMSLFPQIPLSDISTGENQGSLIDKQYSSYVVVAVCKTVVNPTDGKITVAIIESFFGSLFDEKNAATGEDHFIGNIINANSKYIEFYRNNFIKPHIGDEEGTIPAPAPYNRTAVPQFYIKDSMQLNNACKMVGIDQDLYDVDDVYYTYDKETGKYTRNADCPAMIVYNYGEYVEIMRKNNIFVFNKKTTILYNNHPAAIFSSFSKKEAQKIIANTTGLFGKEAGTTANIGDNFIKDMDRCITFIKNVDDIPIYFVADAGLSTIAQFCDNVVWDPKANDGAGKWVTQNFDPDNDPDIEDRAITSYSSVATWRKVINKLDEISKEIRRDCMTIIDAPRQLTLDGAAPKIRRSKPDNNWDEEVGEKLRFITGLNSSYTAGYYNWLRATDEFSGLAFWMPPTCKIIGNYMYLNIMNLPWLAPAGMAYGTINGVYAVSHNPSPNEEDQIYLKSWNYIKQYPVDGFVIEGQKTTLTKNSAFNRVNVRTLFLDLERFVYNVSRTFKYTINNQYTREQFVQTIRPRFEDYMMRGGIYDYLIKCDNTNNTPETIDKNELRAAFYIKPARLVEFIIIDFVAAKTSANFEEIPLSN